MAISKNLILANASGKLGNIVIRQRGGKTILSAAPRSKGSKPTASQSAVRQQFARCAAYARTVTGTPVLKEIYQQQCGYGEGAYIKAMNDAFHAPVVERIDAFNYTGYPDQDIYIRATDNFKVVCVKVWIYTGKDNLIEYGKAALQPGTMSWIYKTTAFNSLAPDAKIVAMAIDMPGNEGVLTVCTGVDISWGKNS